MEEFNEVNRLRASIDDLSNAHSDLRELAIKIKKQRDSLEKVVSLDTVYISEIKTRYLTSQQQNETKAFELERQKLLGEYYYTNNNHNL